MWTYYHGTSEQADRSKLALTVCADEAGWYTFDMAMLKQNSSWPACSNATGQGTGGDRIALYPGFYEYAAPVGDERIHSTQKPVGLIRDLMEVAPEGCVVLDPFMGSGTTAVAAVQTGRHFVGFELSREYCDAANRRVRAVTRGGGELDA